MKVFEYAKKHNLTEDQFETLMLYEVARWHESPEGIEIYEFLGMSRTQYAFWVVDPEGFYKESFA